MTNIPIPPGAQRHPEASIPRCQYCGEIIRSSSRRPRGFCSNGCRQAAYRERRPDALSGPGASPYRAGKNNEPAAKSLENSSTISTVEFRNKSTPSVPLNFLGGHCWPDADFLPRWSIKAVIDAEIGCGRATIVSPDGIRIALVRKSARG